MLFVVQIPSTRIGRRGKGKKNRAKMHILQMLYVALKVTDPLASDVEGTES